MSTKIFIDPVTRLEGHLKIAVTVNEVQGQQQVVNARATGTMFRGFEQLLVGRNPSDAQHLTQRICGVCPVPHGMASVMAQDAAYGVRVPSNARIMRNLVLGANFVQSHILHFYHLTAIDYVDGPAMPPWQPSWQTDKRISGTAAASLVNHYVSAIDMTRKAHEMGALFGGRMPHPPTYVAGGFTATPRADRISNFTAYLNELIPFIQNVYLPDVAALRGAYPEYATIGRGYGNLLSFGVFNQDSEGSRLLRRGRAENGATTVLSVDSTQISESVRYSWYEDSTTNLHPSSGQTLPKNPKAKAYSWLKAPRYAGAPYEVGPLARMWVNGDYRQGISVMDRHQARAQETLKIAQAMQTWVTQLQQAGAVYTKPVIPPSASGAGLTEAPRGALGHWLQTDAAGKVSRYQVITPTCWNASPQDDASQMGPLEKALIDTPVRNINEPIEVLRVIHSFDPCLACAVHVSRPKEEAQIQIVAGYR